MNKKKLFIVDDDIVALESLKKILQISGYDVESVSNPKEAVNAIRISKPDLILLDMLMPHLGGLEICEMLNCDEETKRIPIIIVSALSDFPDIKKAFKLGVVGYMTKPYDMEKLLSEIIKAIG